MSAVALISENPVLRDHFAQVFQGKGSFSFSVLENSIIDLHGAVSRLGRLDLMIVDLAQERDRAISAIGSLRSNGVPWCNCHDFRRSDRRRRTCPAAPACL